MKKLTLRTWIIPVALLAVCVLSYGMLVTRLGYYWDDWTAVWYIRFLGPGSFQSAYAGDRPLLAWVVTLTTSLLGWASPLAWQIFGVLARWLFVLAFWWALLALWPKKLAQITAAALLFAVYPGFNQQFIAITYSNGFIVSAIFMASLGAMLWAFRKPRWFWPLFILSVAFCGYAMFAVEYYFGLELLRPVLLWIVLSETVPDLRKRFRRVILYWLPYLALMTFFVFYRVTHTTPRAQITLFERLSTGLIPALLELSRTILNDLLKATVLAWKQALNIPAIFAYEPVTILKYTLIILAAGILAFLFLVKLDTPASNTGGDLSARPRWGLQALLIGVFALLVGGLPIWVTNLRMELFFPWDRFTLTMMLGASLLVAGLIEILARKRWQSAILAGVLVGLAAGMHYQSALTYRKEWLSVKEFFWQLTWRAPSIQPGTVLLTSELPFLYDWDNSLTAPLNWTYDPHPKQNEFLYAIYNVESHLSSGLPELTKNSQINEFYRIVPFSGSPAQAILVYYHPPGCLKVIDPAIDQRLPEKPLYFREVAQFSNPGLIGSQAGTLAQPPAPIFGAEPAHDWCYYFEKADLASHSGDWQEVADLGDQALAGNTKPYRKNTTELVPFIRGYAHVGEWDKAEQLSLEAFQTWDNTRLLLCDVWRDIHQTTSPDSRGEAAYDTSTQALKCGGS